MSDTVNLFIIAGAWSLVAIAIVRLIPNWPARIAAFALLVGIPFWELPYGYYNFQKLCAEQTKVQILEKLPPQDSICLRYFDLNLYRNLVQAGFIRIEVTGKSENAREHISKGNLFLVSAQEARSSYCMIFENNISMPWRILRADTLIVRANDNRPVARQSYFRWDGTWWQKQASPVLGIGGVCSGEINAPIHALRRGAI